MKVFERTPHNCRKIVVATNIAETSITINGIVYSKILHLFCVLSLSSLPKETFLVSSTSRTFADNILKVTKIMNVILDGAEKILEKGENAG